MFDLAQRLELHYSQRVREKTKLTSSYIPIIYDNNIVAWWKQILKIKKVKYKF
jgi:hypothetical protein